ncbi:MAG: penicillin-binding protein 2, partial [Caballeronia sp.]|nr:penicillin-binding protein 2 [Caballeronia sp.]
LPSTEWKKKAYRKPEQQRWYEGETISLGIGQGYNSFTILQLAHATATLANDGVVMKPHLVKEVENPISKAVRVTVRDPSYKIAVKQADVDFIKRAMEGVVTSGTGAKIFRGAPYVAAGKTGTAQVYSLQGANYSHSAIAEHLRDHALFIAFAPADHPTIAVALIVENGGWGAESAGPIARKVLDYYLVDRLKPGAEAAAVAAAASATEDAGAPVIGGAQSPVDAALPASVTSASPAFNPLAASGAAAGSAAASASVAASDSAASASSGAGAASSAPAASAAPAVPVAPSMLRALEAPRVPVTPITTEAREIARPASGSKAPGVVNAKEITRTAEVRKTPATKTPPTPPSSPKEPPPTAAIPRNAGKSAIQTLTPSGGIDE